MADIKKFPNRSPRVTTKTYSNKQGVRAYPSPKQGGFEGVRLTPDKPANANVSRAAREAAIRSKYSANKGVTINSGKYAYGTTSSPTASRIAGAVGRGVIRAAGPVGALVSMTKQTGDGREDKPSGPLMRGNAPPSRPNSGPTSAPSRTQPSAPSRTQPSAPSPSRPNSGPTSAPSRTQPSKPATATASRPTSGPTSAPSRTQPSKPATASRPTSGPTSAPSRTQPSSANLGTSRFAKGGMVNKKPAQIKGWGKARKD